MRVADPLNDIPNEIKLQHLNNVMSALSRRQLLLTHAIRTDVTGNRFCSECNFKFGAASESAAWYNHWKSFHSNQLADILHSSTTVSYDSSNDAASSSATCESISSSSSISIPTPKKRKTLGQLTLTKMLGAAVAPKALASLTRFLTRASIGFCVVEMPEFKEFLADLGWTVGLPTPKSSKLSMLQQSRDLRNRLVQRLLFKPITVAVDGWTNVKQEKVTNVCLIAGGIAYYWCSIVNTHEKNDAEWVATRLSAVFRTLIDAHHLQIVALVVDNESVNKAIYSRLVVEFPFLIYIPCAAHTVQLVVRSCLVLPTFANTIAQLHALIRFFDAKVNRNALKQLQMVRGVPQRVVVKPNDTRWSSTLQAAQRMLLLRREAECCFDEESLPFIKSKESFFKSLADLIEFLRPFQIATDEIQQDKATLYTVYTQFTTLLRHTTQRADIESTRVILNRWEQRLNVPATLAVAILSFATLPPSLHGRSQEARQFIRDFGASYLTHYQLCGEKTQKEMRAELINQLAHFNARSGIFVSLDEDKEAIESQEKDFDPRLVWSLYSESSLSRVAVVLLSISASEAAVERSFSCQAAVHSKERNRMNSETIEGEMFLKVNHRLLQSNPSVGESNGIVEMDSDFDSDDDPSIDIVDYFAHPPLVDETPTDTEEETKETVEMEIESDSEAPAESVPLTTAADRRRLRRDPSIVHSSLNEFIEWFIKEHHITSSTSWNSDLRNTLVRYCSRIPPPVPNAKSIEDSIRLAVVKSGNH